MLAWQNQILLVVVLVVVVLNNDDNNNLVGNLVIIVRFRHIGCCLSPSSRLLGGCLGLSN